MCDVRCAAALPALNTRKPSRLECIQVTLLSCSHFAVLLPGLAHGLQEVAASVVNGTAGTTASQGVTALAETLTNGLLEDALDAFELAVAAVDDCFTVRQTQRAFTALVMRVLGVRERYSDADAERAGARLLKQALKVRETVAKASNSGEVDKMDSLRRAPYPAAGAPPLPWETVAPTAPAPEPSSQAAPAPAPAAEPEFSTTEEPQPTGRVRIPPRWRRKLGADACVYVQEYFDEVWSEADKRDEAEAEDLVLVVQALVRELRDGKREAQHAEAQAAAADERAAAANKRADRREAAADAWVAEMTVQMEEEFALSKKHSAEHRAEIQSFIEADAARDKLFKEQLQEMEQTLEGRVRERVDELEGELEAAEDRAGTLEARLEGRLVGACPWCLVPTQA